jgi:hypothetical protein
MTMPGKREGADDHVPDFILVEALEQLFEVFPGLHAASSTTIQARRSVHPDSGKARNEGRRVLGNQIDCGFGLPIQSYLKDIIK